MKRELGMWRVLYRVTMANGSKFMVLRMCQSDGNKVRLLELFDKELPHTMIGTWADKVRGLCTFETAVKSEFNNETVLLYKNQIAFVEVLDAKTEVDFLKQCDELRSAMNGTD